MSDNLWYDAAKSQLETDQATQIRNNLQFSLDANPKQEAGLRQLYSATGIPLDSIRDNEGSVRAAATLREFDAEGLVKANPRTAQLLTDQNNTKLLHDAIPNTQAVEDGVRVAAKPATAQGMLDGFADDGKGLLRGIGRSIPEFANKAAGGVNMALGGLAVIGDQFTGDTRASDWWFSHMVKPAYDDAEKWGVPKDAKLPEKLGGSLGGLAATLAAIYGSGGAAEAPALAAEVPNAARIVGGAIVHAAKAMWFPAVTESINTGRQVYEQTGDANAAFQAAEAQYGVTTGMGVMPLSVQGKILARTLSGFLSGTVSGEVSRQGMNAALPEGMQTDFNWENTFLSGTVGSLMGAAMGPRSGRPVWIENAARADASKENMVKLQMVSQVSAASALRERDPAMFRKFVEDVAADHDAPDLYIDAKNLTDAFAQSGVKPEDIQKTMPDLAAQLDEAMATKGMVRIPMADYATHLAGTDIDTQILPHIRTDPEGMTYHEGQVFYQSQVEQLKAEVAKTVSSKIDDSGWQQSKQAVQDQVQSQIADTGRVRPDVASAYAALHASFFEAQAEKFGTTPQDAYDKLGGAKIVAEDLGGDRFAQTGDGPFGPVYAQFKGDAAGAVAHLIEQKSGEAVGALHHPDIGDIDLVWGKEGTGASDGYGLAKLLKHHPEVVGDLQGILSQMSVVTRSANRVNLESSDHRAAVRLTWDDQAKHWLMTMFEKKGGPGTRTDTAGKDHGEGDTARLPAADASIDQDLNNFYQGNRGAYSPADQTIALLKGADLTTFLHESGHFFLDTYSRVAKMADAPEAIKQDFSTLLKSYGVADAATWDRMSVDEQRQAHESFARGFEAYLMEGKAPSVEMAGLFARFRSWLLTVYKNLSGLNVELTPEVRGVMDRMLATEETIKTAESVRGLDPLFKSAEAAGMTPEEWAGYQSLGSEATRTAVLDLQGKSLRDMKWLTNAKKGALREMQAKADARRKEVRESVSKEVDAIPAFQAADYIRANSGDVVHKTELADWRAKREQTVAAAKEATTDKGERAARLTAWEADNPKPVRPPTVREQWAAAQDAQRVDLKTAVKAEMWAGSAEAKAGQTGIQKGQFFAKNSRMIDHEVERRLIEWANDHPRPPEGAAMPKEFVAEMFGFTSVDEMTAAIKEAGSKKDTIEALTDKAMLERYGELSSPEAIQRAAEAAIHNEVRGRFVATELKALTKAAGPAAMMASAAKAVAEASIAGKLVGALRPSMYAAAEARSARNAHKALASNDLQAAAVEKRSQLLSNQLAKAAQNALQEIGKGVDYLKKFDKPSVREKVDVDYRDQIDGLLDRFDLRKGVTKTDIARRESLASWVESQAAQGLEPNIPEKLLNELDQKHYMQMTVEEFRGLVDAVKSIEHLGRLKNKLRDRAEMREIDDLADEAVTAMGALPQRTAESNRGMTRMEAGYVKLKSWGRTAQAGLLKMEQMMDWLDGRNPDGVFNRVVFRRLADAGTHENDLRVKVKAEIDKLLHTNLADVTRDGEKIYVAPGLVDGLTGKPQKFTKKEMLMLAGNMGNDSNTAKLLAGEKWSEPAVWAFLDQHMSKADWDFVAGMGRAIESLWPEQLAMNRRLGNTNPEKIAPRAFTTRHGDYDGWYWPMIYDPARAQDVAERGAKKADALFENSYTKANTDTGRMNTRNENYAKPLLLDLDALPRVIMDNIHDIAFREAVIDADKFLSHPKVRDGIIGALSQEHYDQLRPWLQSIANDGKTSDDGMRALKFFNSLAHGARTRATIVGLGYRVTTMLVHGASAGAESVAELGAGWFGKGLKEFGNPAQWSANRDFIFDRSGEMRNRMNEVDRDVREHLREIELRMMDPATGAYSRATDAMKAHAYQGIAMLDMASALPTWMGAYLKGMSSKADGGHEMGEQDAIYFADKTVRNAHGGTGVKDQAAVQRGPEFFKLFSMFYTFWNHNVNRLMDTTRLAKELPATYRAGDMAKFRGDLGSVIMRTMIYTFGVQIMHHMLHPPKEGAPEDSWFVWASKELAMAATAGIPIVRDLAAHYISGKDYSVTPAASMVDAIGRSGQDIWNASTGEKPVSDKWLKHTITTSGYVFGLPTGQAASASQFLWDVQTGQQHPEDVADWWRGLVHGDMKKH